MKSPKLNRHWSALALVALMLAGCKDQLVLQDATGTKVGSGVLQVSPTFPSPIQLNLEGREYTGSWNRVDVFEPAVAKSRRRLSERAYLAYIAGNDPAQLKHGEAKLTARDGSEMHCDFWYRGEPASGNCKLDGKQITFVVM